LKPSVLELGGFTSLNTVDSADWLAAVAFAGATRGASAIAATPNCSAAGSPEPLLVTGARDGEPRVGLLDVVVFSCDERPVIRIWPAVDQTCAMGQEAALHVAGITPGPAGRAASGLAWVGFDVKTGFAATRR
jgi:hypothetical protein